MDRENNGITEEEFLEIQEDSQDYVGVDISEIPEIVYEEETDEYEFEDDEPKPFITVLAILGVVIALAIVGCIVFLVYKTGNDDKGILEEVTQTEQTISAEEAIVETQTISTEDGIIENQIVESTIESESEQEVIVTQTSIEENEEMESETLTETIAVDKESEDLENITEDVSESTDTSTEPISGNESMEFVEISDTVTAKDVTNLRSIPSTLDSENVVGQLLNGEVIDRIGVNEAYGWSRLDWNGQVVYAVSNYLTTDLNYKTPVIPGDPNRVSTQDGRVIIFVDYDDYVTPKEYVNLRVEPSTSEGESTVRCQIKSGDRIHRTGYSPDSGWSRVEYNGEILYVVSSMVNNV